MLIAGDNFSSKSLLIGTKTFTSTSSSLSQYSHPLSLSLLSLSSSQSFPRTRLALRTNGSRVSASKSPKNPKDSDFNSLLKMEGLRSFGDEIGRDFDDDGDGDEDVDEEESEGFYVPFDKNNEWFENKPRGFGEGKVYDTGIEEQLLDEMRQSMVAQAANLNKLKNEPLRLIQSEKKRVEEVVPSGVRVRVTNLPKKKNVHRDLSSAFKGVPGLISINPAVSGNKKTRDPICKGFGFVYFKSEKDASRFVDSFSQKSITFGKIEKQIKCEIAESLKSQDPTLENSKDNAISVGEVQMQVEVLEDDETDDYSKAETDDDASLDGWEISIEAELDDDEDLDDEYDEDYESEWEDDEDINDEDEDIDSVTELEQNADGSYEQRVESEPRGDFRQPGKRLSVKDKDAKVPMIKTIPATKGKVVTKVPKLNVPGSAKRLKVKEKAMLNDVLSKYGKKSAVASKKAR